MPYSPQESREVNCLAPRGPWSEAGSLCVEGCLSEEVKMSYIWALPADPPLYRAIHFPSKAVTCFAIYTHIWTSERNPLSASVA